MSVHADQIFARKARAEHTRKGVIFVKKKKPVLHWWPCKTWYHLKYKHLKYKHRKKGTPESNIVYPDTPNTQLNPTPTEKTLNATISYLRKHQGHPYIHPPILLNFSSTLHSPR
jgi:hypothetical protein